MQRYRCTRAGYFDQYGAIEPTSTRADELRRLGAISVGGYLDPRDK